PRAPAAFKDFVVFESASTLAEGTFDDLKGLIALSNHTTREETLRASTRARAEIHKIAIGKKRRVSADRVIAELRSHSPTASGEPPIRLGDVAIEGVRIDGFELKVVLEQTLFQRYDTRAKLLTAADDPDFVHKNSRHFLMTTEIAGPAPAWGRL